ncbi:MAG: ABC transporter ATP-binding protein [Sorangiineae bacterium]|nr:ABC transporter ATP-binding protein [Polyangiaceae bacterium]MEB2323828.1 ABC transporter ATP-binding protein [Sorangiineae bacterium]
MIEARDLIKDYGTVVAVRGVSFEVGKGEIVGVLGPNGAGKSTTLRILAGFLGATSGTVRIDGHDIVEASLEARRAIGYMPEAAPLYPELRVSEYLSYRAALKKVPRAVRKKSVERAMAQAVVTEMASTLIGHLSKGYRQRVGLADALVSNPPLLILDEPTAGLDPNQIREVRKLIRELGETHTILLSTHILSEVESTCDRAIVISRGKLVAEGTIDELRAKRSGRGAALVVRDDGDQARRIVSETPGVRRVKQRRAEGALLRLEVGFEASAEPGTILEALVGRLVAAGVGVRELSPSKTSLEDVFAALTGGEEAVEDDS